MNNIDSKSLVENINNSLVLEGMSINQIAKMLKCKRTDIFDIMKKMDLYMIMYKVFL